MSKDPQSSGHEAWARLRFAIIGPLLAAPPPRGRLRESIEALAAKTWLHPVRGESIRFAASTIEAWYYRARKNHSDPVAALRRALRKDVGRRFAISEVLEKAIFKQHRDFPDWSYTLHFDNLRALSKERRELTPLPSYSTLVRFMKSKGLIRRRRPPKRPGEARAQQRHEQREVRSFEVPYVGSLWHLDFHQGSQRVLLGDGRWVKPQILAIIDDHSRLCCHLQWYLAESAEVLVHGLSQAFAKRGLPRALLTDNGAAMTATETRNGLARLGIVHETTLPYSPYQNGKQEALWGQVEGRLLAMLRGVKDLRLPQLNEATQAWVEFEYNRRKHSGTGAVPLDRFLETKSVLRNSASRERMRAAFAVRVTRKQRRSDGTLSLEGVRLEVPDRFRHLERLTLRYARWDLGHVELIDPRTDEALSRLYPLDLEKNAEGKRRPRARAQEDPACETPAPDPSHQAPSELPPLLRKLLADYAATGLPPAYIPMESEQ